MSFRASFGIDFAQALVSFVSAGEVSGGSVPASSRSRASRIQNPAERGWSRSISPFTVVNTSVTSDSSLRSPSMASARAFSETSWASSGVATMMKTARARG